MKTQKKFKELEIMCQNAIFICIFWYSKICWFPMKNCWCQHDARDVSRDSYIFWLFFRQGITAKFHQCRMCVTDFTERRAFLPPPPPLLPHPWAAPKKPILDRVNWFFSNINFYLFQSLFSWKTFLTRFSKETLTVTLLF